MKKKHIRKLFLIIGLILILLPHFCYAMDIGLGELSDYGKAMEDQQRFRAKVEPFITVIQTIGSLTSVIVLIILGIKYMAGSVEEKAEYKKTLIPYVIGCALVFAISNLLGVVYDVTTGVLK